MNRLKSRNASFWTGAVVVAAGAVWAYFAVLGTAPLWSTLVMMVLATLQIGIRLFRPASQSPDPQPSPEPVIYDALKDLVASAAKRVAHEDPQTLIGLVFLLTQPAAFRSRVVESLEFGREFTVKAVRTNIRPWTPDPHKEDTAARDGMTSPTTVLIPLIQPPKAKLYNSLEIAEQSGLPIMSLSHRQGLEVVLACIIHYYRLTYSLSADIADWPDRHALAIMKLARIAATTRQYLSRPHDDQPGTTVGEAVQQTARPSCGQTNLEYYTTEISDICPAPLGSPPAATAAHMLLLSLLKIALQRYLIIVEAPRREWYRFTYSYRHRTEDLCKPMNHTDANWFTRTLSKYLRVSVGLIAFNLTRAPRAGSYHLYLTVPSGSYIGPTSLVLNGTPIVDEFRRQLSIEPRYFRMPEGGSSEGHFYARGLDASPKNHYSIRARVYERPSRTEFLTMIWALVFVVVSAVMRVGARDQVWDNVDWLSATTAVPVFIVAIVSSYAAVGRFSLFPSRSAVAISVAALAVAVVEGLVFMSYVVRRNDSVGPYLPYRAWFWDLSLTASCVLAALAVSLVIIRSIRFARIRHQYRRPPQEEARRAAPTASALEGEFEFVR